MMQFIFKASGLLVLMLYDKLVDKLLVISAIAYQLVRDVC